MEKSSLDNRFSQCQFGSKAEVLSYLTNELTVAQVLPLFYFNIQQWSENPQEILTNFSQCDWANLPLIVRSSAKNEDTFQSSLAGHYTSVINISLENLVAAIEEVISSYASNSSLEDQVLIQPMLQEVKYCGVAFGCDPNTGSDYIVINYDDNGKTDSVTAGYTNTFCHYHYFDREMCSNADLQTVVELIKELSSLFLTRKLDVEFAIASAGELYLLQVRPLVNVPSHNISCQEQQEALARIENRIKQGLHAHPYLYGSKTIYTVMTDWNPAEIIGVRPKRLALSLYKELITDSVWAYQRDNYGYRNLRSFPLIIDFEGFPYIDARVSLNSFIPKRLPDDLAEKLVNYYVDQLRANPELHDKVEFDIVFSCYTTDLESKLETLLGYDFTPEEIGTIFQSLVELTNRIIHKESGLWVEDLRKINILTERYEYLTRQSLDPIVEIYWLVEDCERYGTLPFAGLARAGFIAVQILKSLVKTQYMDEEQYHQFMTGVESVSSLMQQDLFNLGRTDFLEKYGHLRPGTYDITSPCYDESPDEYFNFIDKLNKENAAEPLTLSINTMRLIQNKLTQDGIETDVLALFEFIKTAIEGREYAKFVFTRSVSRILKLIESLGKSYNFSREECAHLDIQDILKLYSGSSDPAKVFQNSIHYHEKRYQLTRALTLPPVLSFPEDAWSFSISASQPNFITQLMAEGSVCVLDDNKDISGSIVFIPNADPGYDWIFSHAIKGFITQYGGVNSHMAIRAVELNLPAVVGAGELLYSKWIKANVLRIDCKNKQVLIHS